MRHNGKANPTEPYYGIFNDSFPPIMDGVTLTVENYVKWLRASGRPACVVTPRNPVAGEYPYEVIRYFSLPIRSRFPYRYGYPKLDPFIWRRLRTTPFRIVHSHCPFSSGRLAVYVHKKQHVPLIGTFHSKYRDDLARSFRLLPWCVPIIMRRILAFFEACDEVWIPQAAVAETVREYGYRGPLEVVENGIDFAGRPREEILCLKQESRRKLGIPDGEISLLFVGQHIYEKGIGIIADALEMIGRRIPFHMHFIGNGYALDELRKTISRRDLDNRVTINGVITSRERLQEFYAAADLFIFPSFYDNAPLVIREAAAMATPSLLPAGSTASEVISDGVNGFLTGRNARAYANEILRLAADRDTMLAAGLNASQTLTRSWKNVVEEVTDRYETLIKRYNR